MTQDNQSGFSEKQKIENQAIAQREKSSNHTDSMAVSIAKESDDKINGNLNQVQGGGMPEPSPQELAAAKKAMQEMENQNQQVQQVVNQQVSDTTQQQIVQSGVDNSAQSLKELTSSANESRVSNTQGVSDITDPNFGLGGMPEPSPQELAAAQRDVAAQSGELKVPDQVLSQQQSDNNQGEVVIQQQQEVSVKGDVLTNEAVLDQSIIDNQQESEMIQEGIETSDVGEAEEKEDKEEEMVSQGGDELTQGNKKDDNEKSKSKLNPKVLLGIIIGILVVGGIIAAVFFAEKYVFLKMIVVLIKYFWWVMIPLPMWLIFNTLWEEYTGLMWGIKQNYILIEVVPATDVEKSPKIMEQVFAGLFTYSGLNKLEKYCGWRVGQDKYSFEIASIEGAVRFFIRCPATTRNNVESQIYAQYPDCEIRDADDYTRKVPENLPNPEWDVWGSVLKLKEHGALPIKTYPKFMEDVTKTMIDPLASMAEVMGSIGKGQHCWFQIVFNPWPDGDWKPGAQEYIEGLMGLKKKSSGSNGIGIIGNIFSEIISVLGGVVGSFLGGEVGESQLKFKESTKEETVEEFNINKLPPGEQEKLKAVYDNIAKPGYNTIMRYVYLGKRENFNKALGVAGIFGALNQFSDVNLNAIVPDARTKTFANYAFTESRLNFRQRKIVSDYRSRIKTSASAFLFNTESLASVFHFPDVSVETAAIQRQEAKKGQAPTNLPGFEPS